MELQLRVEQAKEQLEKLDKIVRRELDVNKRV